jgi:predicted Zn-dependent protease
MTSRIEIFKQMLASDPVNSSILFGLAKEYEKASMNDEMIEILSRYLEVSDDEGNAYGMLAHAYERAGQREKAKAAYEQGIAAASAHGHPSMAEEYRMTLSSEYDD